MSSTNYIPQNYTANTTVTGKGYAMIYPTLLTTSNTTATYTISIKIDGLNNIDYSTQFITANKIWMVSNNNSGTCVTHANDSYYYIYNRNIPPFRVDFTKSILITGNMSAIIYLEVEESSDEEE